MENPLLTPMTMSQVGDKDDEVVIFGGRGNEFYKDIFESHSSSLNSKFFNLLIT